jgi:hypothetical protein
MANSPPQTYHERTLMARKPHTLLACSCTRWVSRISPDHRGS